MKNGEFKLTMYMKISRKQNIREETPEGELEGVAVEE